MSEGTPPRDHAPGDAMDDDDSRGATIEDHVKSKATWLRALFMLVFMGLYFVSRFVLFAVVLLQFFWLLFSGAVNEQLRALGQALAIYTYQIVRYLTFNTELRPFPFDASWPPSEAVDDVAESARKYE